MNLECNNSHQILDKNTLKSTIHLYLKLIRQIERHINEVGENMTFGLEVNKSIVTVVFYFIWTCAGKHTACACKPVCGSQRQGQLTQIALQHTRK